MKEKSFWEKNKRYVIGLFIIALFISILTPASIGIPSRTIDEYNAEKNQIANIVLVEKTDNGAIFGDLGNSQKFLY